jgi:magnesium chelatase family protein
MIAKRIPTIMPDLSFEECMEITKIHSIAGTLSEDVPIINTRPFRSPHHTISPVSLVGGGRYPKPGEISLAHYGVLFLDELPEFNRSTLEVLRGPLEDGEITIGRATQILTFPSKFMLVASMNPCPCGYYGSDKECKCSDETIKKYLGKISGPLLDRIDIQVEVSSVKYDNLDQDINEESSENIRKRVNDARIIQLERYEGLGIYSNSELTPALIQKFCKLDKSGKYILKQAFQKLGLSARAYDRILKVARTIADLDKSENILSKHLLEAVQYRSLDKKYYRR